MPNPALLLPIRGSEHERMSARGYPEMRLAEVVEFLDEMRRDLHAASRRSGPYPYFGSNGQQGSTDAYLFDEPLVLLAEDLSAYLPSDRPLAQAIEGKAWVSRRIHVLRPKPQIVPEFLARVLERFDVASFASGAQGNRLTRARAANIRVPVPSLDEQRSIAAILAQADQLRERRRRTNAQLDAFVRVYFLEHFGDPQTNPRRWPRLVLGALGVLDHADAPRVDGERLLIAADGINLVTRLEPVSQVVDAKFALSEHVHVVASNGRADLHYLHHAIELSELRPYLTSVTRPKLNRAALGRISVPVPPLELQRAFRAVVEKARAVQALQQVSGERLDELYTALRSAIIVDR